MMKFKNLFFLLSILIFLIVQSIFTYSLYSADLTALNMTVKAYEFSTSDDLNTIEISKSLDNLSPKLFKFMKNHEKIDHLRISFYKSSSTGYSKKNYYLIDLRNVQIINMKLSFPLNFVSEKENIKPLENITLTYSNIKFEDLNSTTSYSKEIKTESFFKKILKKIFS